MSEKITFTADELAEIKSLQDKFQKQVFQFGQLRLERMRFAQVAKQLEAEELKADETYSSLQTEENTLLEKFMKKYGAGQLNLADGTFTSEPVTAKDAPPTSPVAI